MEHRCMIDKSVKDVIVFYINEKALIGRKKSLSNYENKLLNLIKKNCESILLNYKYNLINICDTLKVNDYTEENIERIKSQIIESLNNDNRPSVKLAIVSLVSMIAELHGYKNQNILMSALIDDIASKISENSEDLIRFVKRDKQKNIFESVTCVFGLLSILCLLYYAVKGRN
ncbi:16L [Yaba monkey tumor virus]|uniref:16L n=1 Tax=Yaba monkey tumor virus (strain VR587) TaxID=928314 RepID=Q6TUZ5_YMTV5|nr:anti-apoptotic membrane protein [Yaba monkey tumor virus]AAR07374.1 16L [Yaba monkey tumor virus]